MPDLVMHITGARPNFPKAAPVIAALSDRGVTQKLVHTGQHYDDNMSAVFFREPRLLTPTSTWVWAQEATRRRRQPS